MSQSERGIEPFNLYGEEYDRWFDTKGQIIFKNEVKLLRATGTSQIHPSVEIGSGSGRFAKALSVDFAVEPSKTLRKISIKNGVIPIAARGENVPFDDEIFRTVFLIVTLCFAENPLEILKEASRILRDDGFLVLGLVLKDSPWGRFYIEKKQKGHKFYSHATFYSLNEITHMLHISGFDIHDVYSTLISPPLKVKEEEPIHGFMANAGFVGVVASKLR